MVSAKQRRRGGEAFSGEGYLGLYTFLDYQLKREYKSVELLEHLIAGIGYRVTFHVSRMDSCWYATKNIGVHLSNNVPAANLTNLLNLEPQVKYEGDTFLTDIHGWTRIEGSFTATGGERYLTIGNFDNDLNTDTLFIGGGVPPSNSPEYWNLSYYYVDAVSVIPDSIYLGAGDLEERELSISIYPNPATSSLTIQSKTPLAQVWLMDAVGRVLRYTTLVRGTQDDHTIDISALPTGIYFLELTNTEGKRAVRKFVKE